MKKMILALLCSTLFATACSNESTAVNTAESLKTTEMKNLDNAFKNLGNSANKPTTKEKRSGTTELSDRRKQTLIPASVALIKSTGISEEEIQRKTNGDASAIIVWATQINLQKGGEISKKLKLEN